MHRLKTVCLIGAALFLAALSCGCGGNGEPEAGSITFSIEDGGAENLPVVERRPMDDGSILVRIAGMLFSVDPAAAAGFLENCNGDRFSVEASVYDENGVMIAAAGPWPCSLHQGSVRDVSAGSQRRISIQARGPDGALRYHGEKAGLEVLPGAVTDAGVIRLMPYETEGYIPMSDGAMIYYEMRGEGPPLILIHGGVQTSDSWEYQFQALSEFYTVIRYDIRYFGRSYKEGVSPFFGREEVIYGWTWGPEEERVTTDLVEIMAYMNLDRAHICGLSIGSSIAAQLAVFHPEMVDKIIFTSPWAWENYPEDEAQLQVLRGMSDKTLQIYGADDDWGVPEYIDYMRDELGYAPATVAIEDARHNCNEEQPEIYNAHVLAWLAGKVVRFTDPNLEAAVREALEKPYGAILSSELLEINTLIGGGIENLEGIEPCANLTMLDLRIDAVTDVTPLAGLTNLRTLRLNENPITDISPIAGLTNLIELNLSKTDVSDLRPIENLRNLEILYLWGMGIDDISAVANLDRLTFISFGNNAISDIGPLRRLVNLDTVWLGYNRITDISPLVDNTGIGAGDEVNLMGNPLDQTSCSDHLPALESRGAIVTADCAIR